ncbi:membrane protein insertase YidC [bacterium]|nr:membrane protein insertase YidC [bacterium]NBX78251.1 membrane protein insertase YidC [bacterium]
MAFKDYFITFLFALSFSLAFQYFFTPSTQQTNQNAEVSAGQAVTVGSMQDAQAPLIKEIELDHVSGKQELISVQTKYAQYTFSDHGAILQNVDFLHIGSSTQALQTVDERGLFLIGLDQKAPMHFTLEEQTEDEQAFHIKYSARLHHGTLYKLFDVYKHAYQIDMTLMVQGLDDQSSVQARVYLGAPCLQPAIEYNEPVVLYHSGVKQTSLEKIELQKPENWEETCWIKPDIFVLQDKYFAHGFAKKEGVVKRAYLSMARDAMEMVLETAPLQNDKVWKGSFYVGPKELTSLQQVDSRLDQLLQYGWFAFIAKPLDHVLVLIKDYVHNFGWALILLTFLLKLLMLPFTWRSEGDRRKNVDMQKKLAYLQKKYAHDPEELNRQRMDLMQKHGVPGLGMCLVAFLNIPIFFALNSVIRNSLHLHEASFLWISNLAASDPYYILPVLCGLVLLFNPIGGGSDDLKQAMGQYMMAVVIGGVMAQLSAGLALFVFVNILFSLMQTKIHEVLVKNA